MIPALIPVADAGRGVGADGIVDAGKLWRVAANASSKTQAGRALVPQLGQWRCVQRKKLRQVSHNRGQAPVFRPAED
ncbi:hypothetical protein ABHF33_00155 [Chitinibacter sp. FCG-7]|uniref:Uncharacterized protein n=1 Tax=Chitinibacter mangrovi TaxID=3153927 RepID=A0AAU7F9J6_9NEIS